MTTSETKDWDLDEIRARSNLETLTALGDLSSTDAIPNPKAIFVRNLNPATLEEDIRVVFAQIGPVSKCQLIRDKVTNQSLQYAFVEYATVECAERAIRRMNNALVDERKVQVTFCQSDFSTRWKHEGDGDDKAQDNKKYRSNKKDTESNKKDKSLETKSDESPDSNKRPRRDNISSRTKRDNRHTGVLESRRAHREGSDRDRSDGGRSRCSLKNVRNSRSRRNESQSNIRDCRRNSRRNSGKSKERPSSNTVDSRYKNTDFKEEVERKELNKTNDSNDNNSDCETDNLKNMESQPNEDIDNVKSNNESINIDLSEYDDGAKKTPKYESENESVLNEDCDEERKEKVADNENTKNSYKKKDYGSEEEDCNEKEHNRSSRNTRNISHRDSNKISESSDAEEERSLREDTEKRGNSRQRVERKRRDSRDTRWRNSVYRSRKEPEDYNDKVLRGQFRSERPPRRSEANYRYGRGEKGSRDTTDVNERDFGREKGRGRYHNSPFRGNERRQNRDKVNSRHRNTHRESESPKGKSNKSRSIEKTSIECQERSNSRQNRDRKTRRGKYSKTEASKTESCDDNKDSENKDDNGEGHLDQSYVEHREIDKSCSRDKNEDEPKSGDEEVTENKNAEKEETDDENDECSDSGKRRSNNRESVSRRNSRKPRSDRSTSRTRNFEGRTRINKERASSRRQPIARRRANTDRISSRGFHPSHNPRFRKAPITSRSFRGRKPPKFYERRPYRGFGGRPNPYRRRYGEYPPRGGFYKRGPPPFRREGIYPGKFLGPRGPRIRKPLGGPKHLRARANSRSRPIRKSDRTSVEHREKPSEYKSRGKSVSRQKSVPSKQEE